MIHKNLSGDQLHVPFRQVFADDAAKTADSTTAYSAAERYSLAYKVDDSTLWVLTAVSPVTWTAVTA